MQSPKISRFFVPCLALSLWIFTESSAFSNDQGVTWLTGEPFRQELERKLTIQGARQELRLLLTELSTIHKVAILLDRRIDPNQEVRSNFSGVSLSEGLTQLAESTRSKFCTTENFVYLGPVAAVDRLRTLIELRRSESMSKDVGASASRRSILQRRSTINWSDLETPREILNRIVSQFGTKVANIEMIPHDLWPAATMPQADFTDAVTVILIQFDLTFRWKNSASEIELVPIPELITIERKYRPKQKPAAALTEIRDRLPAVTVEIVGSDVLVKGMAEDHDVVVRILRGESTTKSSAPGQLESLKDRRYTLRVSSPVSVRALMERLEESKIRFEYNADDLKKAKIDLDQMIPIDVRDVSAERFFQTIFDPVGLDFRLDYLTVTLTPKRMRKQNDKSSIP